MPRVALLAALLTGCPVGQQLPEETCIPDPDTVLTDQDVLPVWGTSIAAHPLMANSPFQGTLTYDNGDTTDVTVTTAYRNVEINAWSPTSDDTVECEPFVTFRMTITLTTDDGAFDETLEALIYATWINEGTLLPAAINEAVMGTYPDRLDALTTVVNTRLDLLHPPTDPVPTWGEVFVGIEDSSGASLLSVGTIAFTP